MKKTSPLDRIGELASRLRDFPDEVEKLGRFLAGESAAAKVAGLLLTAYEAAYPDERLMRAALAGAVEQGRELLRELQFLIAKHLPALDGRIPIVQGSDGRRVFDAAEFRGELLAVASAAVRGSETIALLAEGMGGAPETPSNAMHRWQDLAKEYPGIDPQSVRKCLENLQKHLHSGECLPVDDDGRTVYLYKRAAVKPALDILKSKRVRREINRKKTSRKTSR